jgi:hypothetical protein
MNTWVSLSFLISNPPKAIELLSALDKVPPIGKSPDDVTGVIRRDKGGQLLWSVGQNEYTSWLNLEYQSIAKPSVELMRLVFSLLDHPDIKADYLNGMDLAK